MKTYRVPHTALEVSRIAYGCMRLGGTWDASPLSAEHMERAARLIATAVERGITLFDHADIYTRGKSESAFGAALKQMPGLRDRIVIQSKCGIRFGDNPRPGDPARYDFSYGHIVASVEGSLRRLQTDYLDILLLHRPDPLVEPAEVARAFEELQRAGKVRYFGVSNHTGAQIALLQRYVAQPLVINQLELNLLHAHLIDEGISANRRGGTYTASANILDECRARDLMVQAWSPVAQGKLFAPPADVPEPVRQTAALVAQIAQDRGTSAEAIVLAWLLRHPAGIQPIVGTTQVERLMASCLADDVSLSREEWYALFISARGARLP